MARHPGVIRLLIALVYGFGVVIHGAVHCTVAGESFSWTSPAHIIMGGSAVLVIGSALRALYAGSPAERRRRFALFRSDVMRRPTRGVAAAAAGMIATAVTLLALEGVPPDPERLGFAVLSGMLALLLALAVLFIGPRALLAIVAALVVAAIRRSTRRVLARRPVRTLTACSLPLAGAGALRAPPLLAVV